MMNPAQEMRNMIESRIGDEITKIANDLAAVPLDHPKLPEVHFREIFLPLFAGDAQLKYNVTMDNWVKVAGSPFQAVDIIDPKSQKVLFTVPPLMDRNAVNPVNNDRAPISHVVASANQYARIHPMQGLHHLNAELTERALIMKVPASVRENIEIWNKIFERYGRPPIMALPDNFQNESKGSTGSAPTQQDTGTADYDFEPL
jgi:hypothetical protein